MRSPRTLTRLGAAALALVLVGAGCSDDSSGDATTTTAGSTAAGDGTTTTITRPRVRTDGPSATFTELTGGAGIYLLTADPGPALDDAGYTETEYAAAGTATAYRAVDGLPTDGKLRLESTTSAPYSTRVVVRRPAAAADFNGVLVVEWLNVSSGGDAEPDYTYLSDELLRGGYAWAGVSAQHIGIEGGPVAVPVDVGVDTGAGKGIKAIDPARYGSLSHPGDAYAYDLFTQVGRGLPTLLDDLDVTTTLAIGESQSAFALTTYANGVQPLTGAFDGFLIHSRGGAAMPLGEAGAGVDIVSTIFGTPTSIRADLDVPTMVVQTETDVLGFLGYFPARQPDTDRLRVWEVAGTAHADRAQIGPVEAALGCGGPINDGQQAFVLRAALRGLADWAAGGDAPPGAEPLGTEAGPTGPVFTVDDAGNVTGGVRTPAVDAPTAVLSGLPGTGGSLACVLMGTTTPFTSAQIAARYPTPDAYAEAWAAATDDAIDAGFVLAEDRDAVIADARPDGTPAG